MKKIYYFYIINFLAAFLLFQIELIISKIFLPKFGGSYLVWGGCVVFFQCFLLLGYLYCHIIIKKIGMFRYRYLNIALILLPLLFFPGRPLPNIYAHSNIPMVLDIFMLLFFSIGAVFFVLATVSVISQTWLSLTELPQYSNPYILYAVSNIGSFLALLTYPFVFEMYFDLNTQLNIWRLGYLLLLVFYIIALRSIKLRDTKEKIGNILDKTLFSKRFRYTDSTREKLFWFLLSVSAVVAFLSVTNVVTYEVAPCPLLWVIPLCIYLVSFVFNFREKIFCPSWIKDKIHLVLGFSVIFFLLTQKRMLPFLVEITAYSVSLFCVCMFCQYELYRSRPKEKGRLTVFYLIIAAGGFIGGIVVTWVVPLVFASTFEYLLGLFLVSLSLAIRDDNMPIKKYHIRWIFYLALTIVLWPLVFKRYNFFGIIFIFLVFRIIYSKLKESSRALCLSLLCVLLITPLIISSYSRVRYIYEHRNYYGIYKVASFEGMLMLYNGTTLHGAQYLDKKRENEPLTYFHKNTPVGKLLNSNTFAFKRIGIVGLGVGTLAAYGNHIQTIDFFELDPDIYKIADLFNYLKNSSAKINYISGDARLSLSKVPNDYYDLLIVDAFSGDSIPTHLLTTQAISEYKRHLKKNGIILFHISNRYLRLAPVLFSNSKVIGAYPLINRNDQENLAFLYSLWVALAWNNDLKKELVSNLGWKEEGPDLKIKHIKPWTDTYSNILSVLDLRAIIDSLRTFMPFYW